MSLFKVKHWWSNNKLQNEDYLPGLQNANCLKVDKFNSHSDSDCILVAEGPCLTIYKPNPDQDLSHTLLEIELGDVILQVDTGKFISGLDDRQIIVLHRNSYSIYTLKSKEGHTDAGDQNQLLSQVKHSFTRKAESVTCGPFGNIKTRDLICIQGIDGSLSFFDQDTFLFMCIFADIIIPAPICYIKNCDSFIICKSTWIMEIFSYQQLREFSELTIRQNKNNIPQWTYNAGEEITQIQVIQTSNNFSSLLILGERHLYCFQDNGLMKFLLKFEYMPICFYAYLIGWYYEPAARLIVMVASDDSKLFIYEGTSLLWCCDLLSVPISISRCFLKTLPGGIVTLSNTGTVNISYLGTEPDLNGNVTPMVNDVVDPEKIQAELEAVEESLQKILENKEDNNWSNIEQVLKIKAEVGKPVQNIFQETSTANDESIHLLRCPVIVILTCEDPKQIQSIQVTYICRPPFECSDYTMCLDEVNGTEIIETQIFLSSESDISDANIKILFTVTESTGKIVMLEMKVALPLSLYCSISNVPSDGKIKMYVEGNQPCIEFANIFTDFTDEELVKNEDPPSTVAFTYRSSMKNIVFKKMSNSYIIEADDFTEFTPILDYFMCHLSDHYKRMGVKDFKCSLKYDKDLVKQVTVKFLRSIESHAKERIKLKMLDEELCTLQRQFLVVQKRLLVQYGSSPPGNCDPLEFLMRDTHTRITKAVHDIIKCKENVCRAGNTMTSIGFFIIYLLRQTAKDDFKIKVIEEMLTLTSLYEHYQEWEEAVAQALTYILKTVFKKTEKDKEKLAPVQDQAILSQINLKRFMKQLRIVLDKIFNEYDTGNIEQVNNITRIEEMVEVL